MSLPPGRLDRFARHIVLPEVGGAGQVALAGKHLVLVGLGGIGSPALQYLAGAGECGLVPDGQGNTSFTLPTSRKMPGGRLPGGWRRRRLSGAFYGAKYIFPLTWALTSPKRQPADPGRRSPGAFGLIPGGARRGNGTIKGESILF